MISYQILFTLCVQYFSTENYYFSSLNLLMKINIFFQNISFVNIFSVENVEQRVLIDSEIWYIFNNNRKFHSYINNLPFPILYERKHDQTSNSFSIFIIVISSNDILI